MYSEAGKAENPQGRFWLFSPGFPCHYIFDIPESPLSFV
jgi:hypothetical protein